MTEPLLAIAGLDAFAEGEAGERQVLHDVSLAVRAGEIYGIVGESGSGKSILLQAVLGLLGPAWRLAARGVLFRGEDLLAKSERQLEAIRGGQIALMLSNPRQHLNPVLSVGAQIAHVIERHQKLRHAAAVERAVALLREVGIPDPAARYHSYPHELSGGMCQRVIIAMGLANAPALILADEPTSGLDVTISVQILDLMRQRVRELGATLVLVSRDLGVIANYCEHVAVMYAGEVVEEAPVLDFFDAPLHPYSRHLVRAARAASEATGNGGTGRREGVTAAASGCRFAPRCPAALDACRAASVALGRIGERTVRCLRAGEIAAGRIAP